MKFSKSQDKQLADEIASAQDADKTHQNPEQVEHCISPIFSEDGAPRKQDRIGGVEDPDEHKRAVWSEPADQAETDNPHDHPDHFDRADVVDDENIDVRDWVHFNPGRYFSRRLAM